MCLFQVSEGHFSTFLLVVLKDARPVLFAVDYIGAKLKFTKLIKSGAIGSSTTSVVQRGDRGAVIFSSSRICSTGPRQNCNIPPVEIVSRYDVKKCGSPKLGTSVATTGWAYGGDLYVLHALNDPKDKSKSYLTLFRVDEQGEHPNCELDLVNLLPLMVAFCGTYTLPRSLHTCWKEMAFNRSLALDVRSDRLKVKAKFGAFTKRLSKSTSPPRDIIHDT